MEISPVYRQQGPLYANLLETAFSFLTAEELIIVRSVCKFWSDNADSIVYKPRSVSEGVRRVFCTQPRFLAESSEILFGAYLAGYSHLLDDFNVRTRMINIQYLFRSCVLYSTKWDRPPGTLVITNKPLIMELSTAILIFPDVKVRRFDLRKQTETVEALQPFAERCGMAAACRECIDIINQQGAEVLDSFRLFDFLIVLLHSQVLRIYDRRNQNRMICETVPIVDIEHSTDMDDRMVIAEPACDGTLLVVPCAQGVLRVYSAQTGAFLYPLTVDWGEEPLHSRFFTKLRIRNGYTAAALSNGRIDIFKGETLYRSFRHPNHHVADFDLGKATLVALFYQMAVQQNAFPTTLKVWDLEKQECLHERTFDEGPVHLEYVEYKRLICECNNGQILVLDPFLVPEPITVGRQIVSWVSFVWNALCDFIVWITRCFFGEI